MKTQRKKLTHKVGLAPGILKYIGDEKEKPAELKAINYNVDFFDENILADFSKAKDFIKDGYVNWLICTGLTNTELVADIGNQYNIHAMLLEDILNTQHLPKFEQSEDYFALIIKSFVKDKVNEFKENHICLIIKDNSIVQFQEFSDDIIESKIERIKSAKGRARKLNADYLFYILTDAFVDTFYLFFESLNNRIVALEERLLENTYENLIKEIHSLKSELNNVRKNLFPLRDALNSMIKEEADFIDEKNMIFFNDVKDHLNQLIELYILYNENLNGLIDLNSSNLNNNINAVMKTLTIIATIFIPLTFIAGLYGMNFKYMPELEFIYGYPIVLFVMLVTALGLIFYMRWKKWL